MEKTESINKLNYSYLTLIHVQVISLPDNYSLPAIERLDKPNDAQHELFYGTSGSKDIMQRYTLPGFDYSINVGEDKIKNVKGTMTMETTIYFHKFAVVRYYMRIDPFNLDNTLTTGDITELAMLGMIENASLFDQYGNKGNNYIDLPIFLATDKKGPCTSFTGIKNMYKYFLTGGVDTGIQDKNYVFVDVWKGLGDSNCEFERMNEKEVISYITGNMIQELNGLLLLTPREWEYGRADRKNTSTGNIALDIDELTMLNENVCISFATYGMTKDSPADWAVHHRNEDSYYVALPEMYLILETVLIKSYALMAANEVFRKQASLLVDRSKKVNSDFVESSLNRNAEVRLSIANVFLQLDNVKLTSHKILSDDISDKFELDKQMNSLETKMRYTDEALELMSDSQKLQQARRLNIVLAILSSVSVLGLLFNQVKPPFIQRVFGISDYNAEFIGSAIIGLSIIIIVFCLFVVLGNGRQKNRYLGRFRKLLKIKSPRS